MEGESGHPTNADMFSGDEENNVSSAYEQQDKRFTGKIEKVLAAIQSCNSTLRGPWVLSG